MRKLPPLSTGPVPSRCLPYSRRPLPRAHRNPSPCIENDPRPLPLTCLMCLAEEPSVRAIQLGHRGRRSSRAWTVARGEGPARAPAARPLRRLQRPPETQAGKARDPSPPPAASHGSQWGRDTSSALRAYCRLKVTSVMRSDATIGDLPATQSRNAIPIGVSGCVSASVICAGGV